MTDKWNPINVWNKHKSEDNLESTNDESGNAFDGSKHSDTTRDIREEREQRSSSIDQSSSLAEKQREPVNVLPSDSGGYVLHPEHTLNQDSAFKYGSEDMISRDQQKQPSGFDFCKMKNDENKPLSPPGYDVKPALTHEKDIAFFGDSNVINDRQPLSRSSLDQDSLHRGSISTLPSTADRRRGSAHQRGVPISDTNDINSSDNNNDSSQQTDDSTQHDANKKSSFLDIATAAVVSVGAAGAAAASGGYHALMGDNTSKIDEKPLSTLDNEPSSTAMPSSWPESTAQQQQGDPLNATTCNYEPAIHGQNACFHTKDDICDECKEDDDHSFCQRIQEPAINGQTPSFYNNDSQQQHNTSGTSNAAASAIGAASGIAAANAIGGASSGWQLPVTNVEQEFKHDQSPRTSVSYDRSQQILPVTNIEEVLGPDDEISEPTEKWSTGNQPTSHLSSSNQPSGKWPSSNTEQPDISSQRLSYPVNQTLFGDNNKLDKGVLAAAGILGSRSTSKTIDLGSNQNQLDNQQSSSLDNQQSSALDTSRPDLIDQVDQSAYNQKGLNNDNAAYSYQDGKHYINTASQGLSTDTTNQTLTSHDNALDKGVLAASGTGSGATAFDGSNTGIDNNIQSADPSEPASSKLGGTWSAGNIMSRNSKIGVAEDSNSQAFNNQSDNSTAKKGLFGLGGAGVGGAIGGLLSRNNKVSHDNDQPMSSQVDRDNFVSPQQQGLSGKQLDDSQLHEKQDDLSSPPISSSGKIDNKELQHLMDVENDGYSDVQDDAELPQTWGDQSVPIVPQLTTNTSSIKNDPHGYDGDEGISQLPGSGNQPYHPQLTVDEQSSEDPTLVERFSAAEQGSNKHTARDLLATGAASGAASGAAAGGILGLRKSGDQSQFPSAPQNLGNNVPQTWLSNDDSQTADTGQSRGWSNDVPYQDVTTANQDIAQHDLHHQAIDPDLTDYHDLLLTDKGDDISLGQGATAATTSQDFNQNIKSAPWTNNEVDQDNIQPKTWDNSAGNQDSLSGQDTSGTKVNSVSRDFVDPQLNQSIDNAAWKGNEVDQGAAVKPAVWTAGQGIDNEGVNSGNIDDNGDVVIDTSNQNSKNLIGGGANAPDRTDNEINQVSAVQPTTSTDNNGIQTQQGGVDGSGIQFQQQSGLNDNADINNTDANNIKSNKNKKLMAGGIGAAAATVGGILGINKHEPNKKHVKEDAANYPNAESESISSTRATNGQIVPSLRNQDEIKYRPVEQHENFKDVPDSVENERINKSSGRKNSLTHNIKTKGAAITGLFGNAVRRLSNQSSSSGSVKKDSIHVRRLSDAEVFKNQTLNDGHMVPQQQPAGQLAFGNNENAAFGSAAAFGTSVMPQVNHTSMTVPHQAPVTNIQPISTQVPVSAMEDTQSPVTPLTPLDQSARYGDLGDIHTAANTTNVPFTHDPNMLRTNSGGSPIRDPINDNNDKRILPVSTHSPINTDQQVPGASPISQDQNLPGQYYTDTHSPSQDPLTGAGQRTSSSGSDHPKYTGVNQDYARMSGVNSMNPTGTNDIGNEGDVNFVRNNEEPNIPSPTRNSFISGHLEQRRGSLQKTMGKLFRIGSMQDKGALREVAGQQKINAYNATHNKL